MNHLVTGGSGFVGNLIARKLHERGERVKILDIWDDPACPPQIAFVSCDIRDSQGVRAAMQGVDIVHHNVAQVPLAKNRQLFHSVNVEGTRNVLDAALANKIKKMVYTSSSAVYGIPQKNPVCERDPPHPGEAYGQSKLEAENLCASYIPKGLDITVIRPRTILGPGRLGIFSILFEWVRQGKKIPVLNGGKNLYQFVHLGDLVEACLLAASKSGSAVYHCGADRFGTMGEAIAQLCHFAKTGSKIKTLPMWPATRIMQITNALGVSPLGAYHALMYGQSFYFDISKAKQELKWQPRYSNEEMLIESYQWYLDHFEDVKRNPGGSHHRTLLKHGILKMFQWFL